MKTYALSVAVCFLLAVPCLAKIINGYAPGIESATASLRSLRIMLIRDTTLSVFQRVSIQGKIAGLSEFITYYRFTGQMLEQFKAIDPDLYHAIDSIRDRAGNYVDVFVKFVQEKEMPAGVAGTTSMDADPKDKHACLSEYGLRTVSVMIAAVPKALFLLAHEFGHVSYQVANLDAYRQYYSRYYLAQVYYFKGIGHNDKDPSGLQAVKFTKRFRERYMSFLKVNGNKSLSYMSRLQQIRNEMRDDPNLAEQSGAGNNP